MTLPCPDIYQKWTLISPYVSVNYLKGTNMVIYHCLIYCQRQELFLFFLFFLMTLMVKLCLLYLIIWRKTGCFHNREEDDRHALYEGTQEHKKHFLKYKRGKDNFHCKFVLCTRKENIIYTYIVAKMANYYQTFRLEVP